MKTKNEAIKEAEAYAIDDKINMAVWLNSFAESDDDRWEYCIASGAVCFSDFVLSTEKYIIKPNGKIVKQQS